MRVVTNNMQQAACVSDCTAYMYLGRLIEFDVTDTIFIKPKRKETEGLHRWSMRIDPRCLAAGAHFSSLRKVKARGAGCGHYLMGRFA